MKFEDSSVRAPLPDAQGHFSAYAALLEAQLVVFQVFLINSIKSDFCENLFQNTIYHRAVVTLHRMHVDWQEMTD